MLPNPTVIYQSLSPITSWQHLTLLAAPFFLKHSPPLGTMISYYPGFPPTYIDILFQFPLQDHPITDFTFGPNIWATDQYIQVTIWYLSFEISQETECYYHLHGYTSQKFWNHPFHLCSRWSNHYYLQFLFFFNFLTLSNGTCFPLSLPCLSFICTSIMFILEGIGLSRHKVFRLSIWCHPTFTPSTENSSMLFISSRTMIKSLARPPTPHRSSPCFLAHLTSLCSTTVSLLFSKFL